MPIDKDVLDYRYFKKALYQVCKGACECCEFVTGQEHQHIPMVWGGEKASCKILDHFNPIKEKQK